MSADIDWDSVGYIKASSHRQGVASVLSNGPAIPTEIAEQAGMEVTHVSRVLRELRDRGLAELLVPEDRHKGRIYGLTEDGENVTAQMHSVGKEESV